MRKSNRREHGNATYETAERTTQTGTQLQNIYINTIQHNYRQAQNKHRHPRTDWENNAI